MLAQQSLIIRASDDTCIGGSLEARGGGSCCSGGSTWMEAETKKNCCLRRSSLPYSVASLGYSTALMSSAFRLCSTACAQHPSPLLAPAPATPFYRPFWAAPPC